MKIIRFIPAFGWFILSVFLLCLPGAIIPKYPWLTLIYADKWVHIFLFGILCGLFCWPFRWSALDIRQRHRYFMWIALAGIVYGAIMEFVQQYWVANRSFEIWDIGADSIGCLLACWFCTKRFGRTKGPEKKLVPMEIGTATKTNCL